MNHWRRMTSVEHATLPKGRLARALVLLWVTCAFVLAFAGSSAFATSYNPSPLTGSKFQAADGNEKDAPDPGASGSNLYDWQQVATDAATNGTTDDLVKLDAPVAGTSNDNCAGNEDAFYDGHENLPDTWTVSCVSGGITPAKSNALAAFGFNEPFTSDTFFDFGFVRASNSNATAFLGFELNKSTQTWTNSVGTTIPCRSNGDLMIAYNIDPSNKNVAIVFYRWHHDDTKPAGPTACPEGNVGDFALVPNFGAGQGYMNFDGAIQNWIRPNVLGTNFDINENAGQGTSTLAAGLFGEGQINVSKSGIAPDTAPCFNYGQVQLHSRSAASLDSALQDTVDPLPVSVANCAISLDKKVRVNGQGSYVDSPDDSTPPVLLTAKVGDTLNYEFTVNNDGTKDLLVDFDDDRCDTVPTAPDSGDDGDNVLQPDETWVYHCDHVLTADDVDNNLESDGTFKNTATVTGTVNAACTPLSSDPLDGCGDSDSDSTSVQLLSGIQLNKSVVSNSDAQTESGLFNLAITQGNTTIDSASDVGDGGSTGPNDVTGDLSYHLDETAGTGTDLDDYTQAIACQDVTDSQNPTTVTPSATQNGSGWDITIPSGKRYDCTITNTRKLGTIELTKHLVSQSSSQTESGLFNLAITQGQDSIGSASDVADGGTTGAKDVFAGLSYHLDETAGTGTDLDDYSQSIACQDVTDPQNPTTVSASATQNGTGWDITVPTDKSYKCTITNTRKLGTIELKKHVVSQSSSQTEDGLFNLAITQGQDSIGSASDVGDGGTTGAKDVFAGLSYHLDETAGTSTDLSDYTQSIACQDVTDPQNPTTVTVTPSQNSSGWTITVPFGKSYVCTITNTRKLGTIELTKHLVSQSSSQTEDGLFNLAITQGQDSIGSASDVGDGGTTGAKDVFAGLSYHLDETAGTSTDLSDYTQSIACQDVTDPQNPTTVSAAATQNGSGWDITVPADKSYKCTITNTRKLGTIELTKHLVSQSSSQTESGKFNLAITQGQTAIGSASNVGDGGTTGAKDVFAGLSYHLDETAGTGTSLSNYTQSIACQDVTDPQNPTSVSASATQNGSGWDITVPTGKSYKCTITNTRKLGTIELTKHVVSQSSSQTENGKFNLAITQGQTAIGSASNVGDGGTTGAKDVFAGLSYHLDESAGTGTSLSDYTQSIACQDVTDPQNPTSVSASATQNGSGWDITVPTGKSYKCTITNTRKLGAIELTKHIVSGSDSQTENGKFNLAITQGQTAIGSASNVGDGGTTGKKDVFAGLSYHLDETAGTGTSLGDYTQSIACQDVTDPQNPTTVSAAATQNGSGWDITVPTGKSYKCTITNTRKLGTIELTKHLVSQSSSQTESGKFNLAITQGQTAIGSASNVGDGGTTGKKNVFAGLSYHLDETAGTATSLSDYSQSIACQDVTDPQNPTTVSAAATQNGSGWDITVPFGKSYKCTITNTRKLGTIELTKHVVSQSSSQTESGKFNLAITQGVTSIGSASNVGDGGTTGAKDVFAGLSYHLDESAGTGTSLSDYTQSIACQDVTDPQNPTTVSASATQNGTGWDITVPTGKSYKCTITNTRKLGQLELKKVVVSPDQNNNDTGTFDLKIADGATTIATKNGVDFNGGTTGSKAVIAGDTYTMTEAAGDNSTSLGDYTTTFACQDVTDPQNPTTVTPTGGSHSYDIVVPTGKSYVCTYTNTRNEGSVKVVKVVNSAVQNVTDDGHFNLRIDGATQTTVDGNGGDTGTVSVSPYTHHGVDETGASGTDLGDYTSSTVCIKNNDTQNPLASTSDFTVGSNDSVVCTITNTRKSGTVKVVKDIVPASGANSDPGKFDLKIDGSTKATDVAYPGGNTGTVSVSPYTNHGVSEAAGTGTTLDDYSSSTVCIKNNDTQNPLSSTTDFSVGSNDSVVCTITNTRKTGSVKVVKDIVPAAGANTDDGKFNLQIDGSTRASDVAYPGGNTGTVSVSPYTHHGVSETAGTGTVLGDYSSSTVCIKNNDTQNPLASTTDFTVGSNDSVVCTITNTRKSGSLEVVKDLNPSTDGGKFNLQIDGATKTPDGGVGDTGSTGKVSVSPYSDHSVSETAASGSDLRDYQRSTTCTRNGDAIANLDPAHVTVGSQDTVVCTIHNTLIPISVSVDKVGPDHGYDTSTLTYRITVTNPGTTNLTNVTVDDKIQGKTGQIACNPNPPTFTGTDIGNDNELSPFSQTGETWVYTCSFAVDHAQEVAIDGGWPTNIVNKATVTAQDHSGHSVSNNDTAVTPIFHPDIQIAKTGPAQSTAGDNITYHLTVTNPSTADESYDESKVSVTDPICDVTAPVRDQGDPGGTTLDPGESWHYTCVASTKASDVGTTVHNVATVVAEDQWVAADGPGTPGTQTDSASADTKLVSAGLQVDKTADQSTAHDGDKVSFTITVKNTSSDGVSGLKLVDAISGTTHACENDTSAPVSKSGGNTDDVLDPGETWTYHCEITVKHSEEDSAHNIVNVAHAEGTTVTGDHPISSNSDDASVKIIHPAIQIDKTGPATAQAGDKVTYVLTVTNPGDVSFAEATLKVSDPACNGDPVTLFSKSGDKSATTFDPGDTWVFLCNVQTNVGDTNVHNVATAQATDQLGKTVTDDGTADTQLTQPAQLLLPERITPGAAQLLGPTGCAGRAFTARVKGSKIATAIFTLDGKVVKKVKKVAGGKLVQLRVNPAKLKIGVHRLVVTVTFDPASGTKPKTMRLSFQRCAKRLVAPQFTG